VMNQMQLNMLKQLAQRHLTCVELASDIRSSKIDVSRAPGVRLIQILTKLGYARDYGDQNGRRVEVRLRIWGITDAGRAVLQQQSLAENKIGGDGQSQLALMLGQKPIMPISSAPAALKRWAKPVTTNQLAYFGKKKREEKKEEKDKPGSK
jgi:hypothetical protein